MRALGLPGKAPLGIPPHVLHLYTHGQDFLDLSARFCSAGLELGECCVWVTAHPWTAHVAFGEIYKHVPNVNHYLDDGQLQFIPYEDWYPDDTHDGLQKGLAAKMEEAYRLGCPRVRFCGNALQPFSESEWKQRVRYEQILQEMVATTDLAVLCSYRTGVFLPETAKHKLLHAHHAVLVTKMNAWEYMPTPK